MIANFCHPLGPSHLVLSFGVTLFEFLEKLYGSLKLEFFQAADGEDLVILVCTILD